ncbi:MAG TPA: 6,7-dimethyl-8-ribityllumazine synthase, partial [Polyangia bacterium]|nr:6,7-dimethyl-8-ribityllumazine synthase [Polyangia bacterium]
MSQTESKASSYGQPSSGVSHEGAQKTNGRRFALVAARFNDAIVGRLLDGARQALREAGAADGDVELFRCPGAMELAGLARRVADGGRFDGIVCLGAVIRGGTPHFDLVAGEAARAIGALGAEGRLPVAFGVLACDTMEQALERSGADKKDNRG